MRSPSLRSVGPMTLLPPAPDPEQREALRGDREWVTQVCARFEARLGLPGPGTPLPGDSAVVARFDDIVLKLFFPSQRRDAHREARVLERLEGQLPVRTPRLLDHGEDTGWPYLVISALPGEDLSQVLPMIPDEQRLRLYGDLGEVLDALHRQPPIGELALVWHVWTRVQIAGAFDRHRRGRCPPHLLEELPGFLEGSDLTTGPRGVGLLHGDVQAGHLRVEQRAGRWELCGLVDFSSAVVGPVDFEYGILGVQLAGGNPEALAAVLGPGQIRTDEAGLSRRLFAMALIHRSANLGTWLRQCHPEGRTLRELARYWFPAPRETSGVG